MASSWKFTGENPLIFTPSLLSSLKAYDDLIKLNPDYAKNPRAIGAAPLAVQEKLWAVERNLGMRPPLPQTPEAAAGGRLQQPLQDMLYPGANDLTHSFDQYMPPVRMGEGLYLTGRPDVVEFDASGRPLAVRDIKTSFWNRSSSKADFIKGVGEYSAQARIQKYTQGYQNAYGTAFGVPEVTYQGFSYLNPNDPADAYLHRFEYTGRAPSLKEISNWGSWGLDTLERLGPEYIHALEKKSQKVFEPQITQSIKKWAGRDIAPINFQSNLTSSETQMFRDFDLLGAENSQMQERVLDNEVLKSYVPGNPATNTGFSLENRISRRKEAHAIMLNNNPSQGGRAAGEKMGDISGGPYPPRLWMWNRFINAKLKGDEETAELWRNWDDPEASWSDVAEVATGDYKRRQEQKAQEKFETQRESSVNRYMRSGDAESAGLIAATQSFDELNDVLIKIADSARAATEAEGKRNNYIHGMEAIKPYDWTRWYQARSESWGNIQQSVSWLPRSVTGPIGRMGDAAMQLYGADVSQKKGIYDAITKGAMPLGASIGALFPSPIPGLGAIIGGSLGGLVGAGSQIIGNIGEGQIRSAGMEISSRGNMWGGIFTGIASAAQISLKALLLPVDLFGKALKFIIPSILGLGAAISNLMIKGLGSMQKLGNPLSAMTNSSYGDYQRSLLMDTMSGMGEGSTSSSVQNMASMRQGFFNLGRYNQNTLIDAAMLGQFDLFYNNRSGNGYSDYNNMVTKLARQMYGQSESKQMTNMYYLQDIDSALATHVQTLLNQYQNTGSTSMDWGQYNNPRTYNIPFRELSDKEREKYRIDSFGYKAITSSLEIDKIRIASSLWERFGQQVLTWVEGLYNKVANKDPLKDILGYVGEALKNVWGVVVQPILVEGFKGFADFLKKGVHELAGGIPSIMEIVKPALLNLADTMFKIFWDLSQSIWDTFRTLIANFSDVKISLSGLMDFLRGKGSLADVLKFTPPKYQQILEGSKYVESPAAVTAFGQPNPNRGSFFDKENPNVLYRFNRDSGKVEQTTDLQHWFSTQDKDIEGYKALTEWEGTAKWKQFSNIGGPAQKQLNDIILRSKQLSIINKWSGFNTLSATEMALREAGFGEQADDLHQTIVDKDLDPYRQFTGDEEAARKKVHDTTSMVLNNVDTGALAKGLIGTTDTVIDFWVHVVDEGGKVAAEKLFKIFDDGSKQTADAVVSVLEDFGKRVDRLSNLELSRATANTLATRAAGAAR